MAAEHKFRRQGSYWVLEVCGTGRTKAIACASAMRNAIPSKQSRIQIPWFVVLVDGDSIQEIIGPFASKKDADPTVSRIYDNWYEKPGHGDRLSPYYTEVLQLTRSDTPSVAVRAR